MALLLIFLTLGCITNEEDSTEDISDEQLEQLRKADEQAALAHAAAKKQDNQHEPNTDETNIPEYDSNLVRNYEIIETEDDTWMDAIRKQYWILVPSDISEAEVKATFIQVVLDETSKNHDIDAIAVFAYDRKVDVGYFYTIGKFDWGPNGNWNVPSEIARSNDRSSYEYTYTITKRVVNSTVTKPNEFDYEVYDYFKIAYDAAWDEIDLSDPYATVYEDVVMQDVAKHYGITAEEADASYMKVVEYQYQ